MDVLTAPHRGEERERRQDATFQKARRITTRNYRLHLAEANTRRSAWVGGGGGGGGAKRRRSG
jgi:hypothetical protein